MDLDLQGEQVGSLFIDSFTYFPWDILVEFVLNELLDGVFDAGVNLRFDLREDY